MEALLRDRLSLVAALGAGVVVGISGIYLYYRSNRCVTRELNQLSGTIDDLRREIEALRSLSREQQQQRCCSSGTQSQRGTRPVPTIAILPTSNSLEDADEEYFDFTDTEEVNGTVVSGNDSEFESAKNGSFSRWFDELDDLLDADMADKESIYHNMLVRMEECCNSAEFLWRLAKVTHLYGIVVQNRGDPEKRKHLAFEAFDYAKQAYEIDTKNPEVHKWYAITIGSLGDYVGTQEKISNGFIFKEHVDEAISLKPHDPSLYYMLGRWCYEVAMLSWLERRVATTLFASPPESSLEEARSYLQKADKLKPGWKENLLFIAKTYIGEGDYTNAISIIDRALDLPIKSEDDSLSHGELTSLAYKYQTYRAP